MGAHVRPSASTAAVPRAYRPYTRQHLLAMAALALVALTLYLLKVAGHMPDFEVYWRAGARALAGEPLYRLDDGHYQFKYLPAFAVLMIPFGSLSLSLAAAVWFAAGVGLLVAIFRIGLQLLPERHKPAGLIVAVTLVALAKFYGREFGLGQVNLAFAVVAAGAILAMRHGRESLAGGLVAASIVLKPYGVILLPWLVARGSRAASAAALGGCAAVMLLPVPLYGVGGTVELHQAWWTTVVSSTAPNLATPDNVSWLAFYTRWMGTGGAAETLAAATTIVALAGAAGIFLRRRGLAFPESLEGGYLLLLIPFVSPQGWDYVLLVGTPAVMLLVNDEHRLPRPLRWITLGALAGVAFSLYDLMGRDAYLAFLNAGGITVLFVPILVSLVVLRWKRVA